MIQIPIRDSGFKHAYGISWYNKPKYFEWSRDKIPNDCEAIWFTDAEILKHKDVDHPQKIAWLIETNAVEPGLYNYVLNNTNSFQFVLTHNKLFLEKLGDKGLFYPFGGCWIKEEDQDIHQKFNFRKPSIIASAKQMTRGHQLRHEIIREMPENLELYGHGYNPIDYKLDALAPYAFSVTIENSREWFTEKLIDCLRTGTVPIYYGQVKLHEYFDTRGILICDNIEKLKETIKLVASDGFAIYKEMLPYITKNFHLAEQYRVAEDWIFNHYQFLFL